MLGKGFGCAVASLSQEKLMHILMQFNNIPATDKLFLAYLFDVQKRTESIKGINAHVKNKPGALEKFGDLMKETSFLDKLKKNQISLIYDSTGLPSSTIHSIQIHS